MIFRSPLTRRAFLLLTIVSLFLIWPLLALSTDAVDVAVDQIGKPYGWGDNGPDSFDCSGLTQYAYAKVGLTLPRRAIDQSKVGELVVGNNFQRGDLVFFATDDSLPGVVTHVGIFEGNGMMIDANSSDGIHGLVKRDNLTNYWTSRLLLGRRVLSKTQITVDGDPSDWAGISPLLTDPQGDGPFDALGNYYPGEDFVKLSVTNDTTKVYLLMEFAGLHGGGITVYLDTDRNPATGCVGANGAEYAIFVTASEPGGHLALSDFRGCSLSNTFPGAIISAPVHGTSRFLDASIPIQTLRTLTPSMSGFRIWAQAVSPPPSGVVDNVLPPATYTLK